MGQTIICEYLANWEEGQPQPDPKDYGFDTLREMLVDCQDTMLALGSSVNEKYRLMERCTKLEVELYELKSIIARKLV